MKWPLFSLVVVFALESTLSDIYITILTFHCFMLPWYSFFYPIAFKPCVFIVEGSIQLDFVFLSSLTISTFQMGASTQFCFNFHNHSLCSYYPTFTKEVRKQRERINFPNVTHSKWWIVTSAHKQYVPGVLLKIIKFLL